MTEEIKEAGLEPVEARVEQVEPVLNEIEQEAFKEGWRPKDQYEGEEVRWIPADEFMRRKPLFSKIDELKSENYHTRKELTDVKVALKQLGEHHKRVRDTEYQRALKELQAVKRSAFEEQDFDTLTKAEEQIDELKVERQKIEAQAKQELQAQVQAPSPEYLEWVKENSWYATDNELRVDADAIALAYINSKRNASPSEVYGTVTTKIKKMHPDKFESKVIRPNPVDSGRSSAPAPKRGERYHLNASEEDVARTLERNGVMTRAEYIESLKKYEERK